MRRLCFAISAANIFNGKPGAISSAKHVCSQRLSLRLPCPFLARHLLLPIFVGQLDNFNSTVIPERKTTDQRIVRPAGFTPSLSSMDVPRVGVAAKKRKRQIIIIAGSALGLILATIAISRLKPAVPSVDRSTVWIDTVKRGPMVRQVRGLGTLVPEDIRWIATNTEGRVEKINIWPGTHVDPDSVILEMSSPELEQTAHDAESKATAAEAALTSIRATLQRGLLDQE